MGNAGFEASTSSSQFTTEQYCPFSRVNQLNDGFDFIKEGSFTSHLPGHPLIRLDSPTQLSDFLEREYCCRDLEKMAPYLWMMSTQSSANINPLHRQRVKLREVVITEDPRLHLIWNYDRVFIKPLPKYLLSHTFWTTYLLSESSPLGSKRHKIRRAALGYIRTYRHLVKYESDFSIAQDQKARLIPPEIDWLQFCSFVSEFDKIKDSDVSGRYHYGELRLTRLNFYGKFILHQFNFVQLHGQYGTYFGQFFGPILFVFAAISVILNSMQVEMAAEQTSGVLLEAYVKVCHWFSIVILISTAVISLGLVALVIYMICDEWVYALKDRYRKRNTRSKLTQDL
jgi:hypothetical protein